MRIVTIVSVLLPLQLAAQTETIPPGQTGMSPLNAFDFVKLNAAKRNTVGITFFFWRSL